MRHARQFGFAAHVLLVLPGAAAATEEYDVRWSATLEAAIHAIASHEADDDVTGFFDQYRFTPSKGDAVSLELGLTEAAFELLGSEETPKLRFRLASPTSNLGLRGAAHAFLNQRAELSGTHRGVFLDFDYHRLRTEDLRRFVDPSGSALAFTDLTDRDDRFAIERTGFGGTLRLRPQAVFEGLPGAVASLGSELELRGAYEARDGARQRRFILAPSNDWLSIRQGMDQEVGTIGGGLLVAPRGLFTLVFDVDHQRFRENASTRTDAALGTPFPASDRTIGFVPDTDRTTGSIRLSSRLGERAEIRGGFQVSLLEQVSSRTPNQRSTGFDDNRILLTSANLVTDVRILDSLAANAFFKYDERNNQIDRDSALFNPAGGTQVDAFLDRWRRIRIGGEIVQRFLDRNRVSLGVKAEWVDRDLDFVSSPVGRRILPVNALVADRTERVTIYGRTHLNPLRGLDFRGEIGYREAPQTGYIVELDDYVFGRANVSYVVPAERPVVVSAFVRGGSGENRDFAAVGGMGPVPSGGRVNRDFERTEVLWGVNATTSPWQRVTLFASFFQSRSAQDYDLVLSDQPRFFQDSVPVTFTADGPVAYRSDDVGVRAGANVRIGEHSDMGLHYSFNRVEAHYRTSGSGTGGIETIRRLSRIDANIHALGLSLSHRLREGLRLAAGYRLDLFDDRSPVHGVGAVRPFDLGTHQHTVTLGVTLSNGFWR